MSKLLESDWMENVRLVLRVTLIGVALSLMACANDPEVVDLSGPAQLVRQRVSNDFAQNPAWAKRKYSSLFERAGSEGRNQDTAMLVACASVESSGLPLYFECRSFVEQKLKSTDAEIRGIALSTLAFRTDSESINTLLEGYDEPDDHIHMPAASALQGRLDSLKGAADTAALIELSRRIQLHCSPDDSSAGLRLCAEAASYVAR